MALENTPMFISVLFPLSYLCFGLLSCWKDDLKLISSCITFDSWSLDNHDILINCLKMLHLMQYSNPDHSCATSMFHGTHGLLFHLLHMEEMFLFYFLLKKLKLYLIRKYPSWCFEDCQCDCGQIIFSLFHHHSVLSFLDIGSNNIVFDSDVLLPPSWLLTPLEVVQGPLVAVHVFHLLSLSSVFHTLGAWIQSRGPETSE